jgi:hypothetical protein
MSGKQKYWQASLSETLSSSESELDPNEPDTYAYTNRVHLAKQLMSLLGRLLRKSELGLYKQYLAKSHVLRLDYQTLCNLVGKIKREVVERLYHCELGSSSPRFLDFFSTHDQFKLARAVLDECEYYAIYTREAVGRLVSWFDPGTFCKLHYMVEPKCVARFFTIAKPEC